MDLYKQIYKQIKKYDKIVLARHIGPDPDALGSTLGLKEVILATFPNKKVFAVGLPATRHKYIGALDKFTEDMYENSLLIVLDTPDLKRVDGVDVNRFKYKIKIDHHPFIEKYADIEFVDDSASSASQLVIELVKNTKLVFNESAAEKLYIGVVGDTERFLHSYTTAHTFELVSYMLKETKIDFTKLYSKMYTRTLSELKLQSYIINNLTLTENGFGFVKLDQDVLDKYETDASTACNIVNNLIFIDKMYAWAIFSYDKANDNIRCSIRSRGPIINVTAMKYNGGGHMYASGARIKSFDVADELINDLDEVCERYKIENNL